MRSIDRFRLAGTVLAALMLCQTASALLAHVHGASPTAGGPVIAAGTLPLPGPASPAHGGVECRACRLRAELDRQAPAPAAAAIAAVHAGSCAHASRVPAAARALWQAGARPARAPPVLA